MTRLRDGDATWLRPTIPPCSRQAQSSRSRVRTEKAGTPRHPGKGRRFSRLATRCCSQPESRRRLEFFGEGEGGGEYNGFVCSRRSLVLDADRKFHVARVRVHFHAVEDPVIQLLFDFLQFDVCHHHPPLSVSTRNRRRAWGHQREAFVISGEGDGQANPAECSLTAGFLIVEIDLTRIGSISRTVRIASDPPR